MKRLFGPALFCAAMASVPALAQDGPTFSAVPTESCLVGAPDLPAMIDCVGVSANACMDSHASGYTTVGMSYCVDQELSFWDARLNAAYGKAMARDKETDAEMKELGATVPSLAEALRAMQRAWIPFRDASGDDERAQWGNGTGGGPAALSCLMYATARQALILEMRANEEF